MQINTLLFASLVFPLAPANVAAPQLAGGTDPRSHLLVYASDPGQDRCAYLMDPLGRGSLRITHDPAGVGTSVISPDGTKLAFSQVRNGVERLWVMNIDGTELRLLTDGPGFQAHPDWSPDGEWIAFTSTREGGPHVWVIRPDGTGLRRVTPFVAQVPSFHPSGQRIAYVRVHNGDWEVFSCNMSGGDERNLSNHPRHDSWPRYSPDGSKIVFYTNRDGNFEVYVMNADGSNQRNLTNNPANDHAGNFSPDGSTVSFISDRFDPNSDVMLMNLDGSNQRRMTTTNAIDHVPFYSLSQGVLVFPASFEVLRGQWLHGGVQQLTDDDEQYLVIEARRPSAVGEPSVQVVFEATAPHEPRMIDVQLTVAASGMPSLLQLEVFNFTTGLWETMHVGPAPQQDTLVRFVHSQRTEEFIEDGTRRVLLRANIHDRGVTFLAWGARFDSVLWSLHGN